MAAVVDALDQHWHATQPGTTAAAQQQPCAHKLVPQSAAEAQASPGEKRAHAPVPGAHARQPSAAAAALQQKPAWQGPMEQLRGAPGVQGAPGGSGGAVPLALAVADGLPLGDTEELVGAVKVPLWEGKPVELIDAEALLLDDRVPLCVEVLEELEVAVSVVGTAAQLGTPGASERSPK